MCLVGPDDEVDFLALLRHVARVGARDDVGLADVAARVTGKRAVQECVRAELLDDVHDDVEAGALLSRLQCLGTEAEDDVLRPLLGRALEHVAVDGDHGVADPGAVGR